MSQLARDEMVALSAMIEAHDCLRRVRDEIERLHRIVFHSNADLAGDRVRRSAEQILSAELVYRHQRNPDGIFFALRALEDSGRSWDEAIRQLAAAIHSYYTTPLGVVIRQDLFGPDVVFIVPDAYEWPKRITAEDPGDQEEE